MITRDQAEKLVDWEKESSVKVGGYNIGVFLMKIRSISSEPRGWNASVLMGELVLQLYGQAGRDA